MWPCARLTVPLAVCAVGFQLRCRFPFARGYKRKNFIHQSEYLMDFVDKGCYNKSIKLYKLPASIGGKKGVRYDIPNFIRSFIVCIGFLQCGIPHRTCRFYCCLAAHQRTRKKDSAEPSFPILWTPPHPPGVIRCGGAYLLPRLTGI